jgi:hypothetical protein
MTQLWYHFFHTQFLCQNQVLITCVPRIIYSKHMDQKCSQIDEGLVPDLLRGRGRLVGGDLDIGEEGSEHTIVTLQSLHHGSVGYQHART